jgi:hypothetical protein
MHTMSSWFKFFNGLEEPYRTLFYIVVGIVLVALILALAVSGYGLFLQYMRGSAYELSAATPSTRNIDDRPEAPPDDGFLPLSDGSELKKEKAEPLPDGLGSAQTLRYRTPTGSADLVMFVLNAGPIWRFGSANEFEPGPSLSNFLQGAYFRQKTAKLRAVVCVGLASSRDVGTDAEMSSRGERLSIARALFLADATQEAIEISNPNLLVFGTGLGLSYDRVDATKNPQSEKDERERRQRIVVLLGVISAKGDLNSATGRKQMVRTMMEKGQFDNFSPWQYAASFEPHFVMRWFQLTRMSAF